MANDNKTVKQIAKEMQKDWALLYFANGTRKANGDYSDISCIETKKFAKRILAAHKREVAELKYWIKSAARWIKCHDIYHTSGEDLIKQAKEILNDDGEFLLKKGEQ